MPSPHLAACSLLQLPMYPGRRPCHLDVSPFSHAGQRRQNNGQSRTIKKPKERLRPVGEDWLWYRKRLGSPQVEASGAAGKISVLLGVFSEDQVREIKEIDQVYELAGPDFSNSSQYAMILTSRTLQYL